LVDKYSNISYNIGIVNDTEQTMEQFKTWEEMSELEQLECTYCEMHKDVYGVKARWYRAESVEQARKDLESLAQALEAEMAREKAAQEEAVAGFMKLADQYGFENAKRYQHDAYGTQGDDEYLCYHLGLPYGFFRKAA
jgi:hypothetical protein